LRNLRHPRLDDLDLTDVLRALSDPARVAIVKALLQSGSALTCGEITGDKPKSSMSHHFKALRDAGIVETRVAGKEHLNRLRTAELEGRFPGLAKAIFRIVLAEDGPRPPQAERRGRARKSPPP
jgi:DNA-binding transcriptional ArsR family regulator